MQQKIDAYCRVLSDTEKSNHKELVLSIKATHIFFYFGSTIILCILSMGTSKNVFFWIVCSVIVLIWSAPTELKLDGTKQSGSVDFNGYNYYYFESQSSGNVEITVSCSDSVWSWVGENYQPYDGDSDWDNGCIQALAADYLVDNIIKNVTYYVGIQGIGNKESYQISAKLTTKPYIEPLQLLMNDQPYPDQSIKYQYVDFYINIESTGNFTVALFADKCSSTDIVELLISAGGNPLPPRTGNAEWKLKVEKSGTWSNNTLLVPFARPNVYQISVWAELETSFYIKVYNNTGD